MSIGGEEYGRQGRTGEDGPYGYHGPGRLTTRTRLPGGEGDGRPPSGRPGRGVVMIVGVVVLLIAAIAFANRGGGGGGGGGADGSGGAAPGAARETAPTGEKPVTSGEGAVPSGFARTEQGAQSAAANYAVALGGDSMYDAGRRRDIVRAVYAPDVVADREKHFDRIYSDAGFLKSIGLGKDGSAPKGSTFVSRTNPVGTKVVDFTKSAAKVSVWSSSLFGVAGEGSRNPVTESWYTDTFDLVWADGEWKVTGSQQKDGPAPVGRDQKASPADKMAEAVEGYGGFTYAR